MTQPDLATRWWQGFQRLMEGESQFLAWVVGAYLVVGLLELVLPAERGQGMRGRGRNLLYFAILISLGLGTLSLWLTVTSIGSAAHLPVFDRVIYLPAYLFTMDFLYYWYHRAQHRFPALWAVHELHHSDGELNVTTSYRTYWLEAPLQSILVGTPVLLLFGRPAAEIGLAAAITARFFLLFAHSNLRLPLGPLTPVFVGPQLHRIHHSILPEHQDKNFAQLFPVIDVVFGTYRAPQSGEYPPTGTPGLASDASLMQTQLRPFSTWLDRGLRMLGRARPTRSTR